MVFDMASRKELGTCQASASRHGSPGEGLRSWPGSSTDSKSAAARFRFLETNCERTGLASGLLTHGPMMSLVTNFQPRQINPTFIP